MDDFICDMMMPTTSDSSYIRKPSLAVGERVVWLDPRRQDNAEYATVRWVGRLPNQGSEILAGVEFVSIVYYKWKYPVLYLRTVFIMKSKTFADMKSFSLDFISFPLLSCSTKL